MFYIKELYVDNFKSLNNFRIKLTKFNCLIGETGVGKSSICEFVEYLRMFMSEGSKIDSWIADKYYLGIPDVLKNVRRKYSKVRFKVTITDDKQEISWEGSGEDWKSITHERVYTSEIVLLDVTKKAYSDQFKGSSVLKYHKKNFCEELHVLYKLFSLKEDSYLLDRFNKFHTNRDNIHEYLHTIKETTKYLFVRKLKEYFTDVSDIESDEEDSKVIYGNNRTSECIYYECSNGFRSISAILAKIVSIDEIFLHDSLDANIEIGKLEKIMDDLQETSSYKQIFAVMYNPLSLNYLEDKEAKKNVKLIYKDRYENTRAVSFFDVPEIDEKLKFMGAGEVYADTCLNKFEERYLSSYQ